jgi:hypothetical protein
MNIKNKLDTGQYVIDLDKNQVTFTDQRFYRTEEGEYLPSVSTILDAYPKSYAFYEWLKKEGDNADDIRDAAGRSGSLVHQATERYDNGETVSLFNTDGSISYSLREWNMIEKYIIFRNKFPVKILQSEQNYVSKKFGFAGTLDRVVDMEGALWLLDIKTSNAVHNHYFLQMAAYAKLFEEKEGMEINNIGILWLNSKTRTEGKKGQIQGKGFQLVVPDKPIEHYWRLFQATKALWTEENGDLTPNHLVYSLSHKIGQ